MAVLSMDYQMSLDARKPYFDAYAKQRCRLTSAFVFHVLESMMTPFDVREIPVF